MPTYSCECCNFHTKLKTDYKRHLATMKHKMNYKLTIKEKEMKMNQNEPKMNRDEPSFIPFLFFSMNQNEPKYNYSKIIIPK